MHLPTHLTAQQPTCTSWRPSSLLTSPGSSSSPGCPAAAAPAVAAAAAAAAAAATPCCSPLTGMLLLLLGAWLSAEELPAELRFFCRLHQPLAAGWISSTLPVAGSTTAPAAPDEMAAPDDSCSGDEPSYGGCCCCWPPPLPRSDADGRAWLPPLLLPVCAPLRVALLLLPTPACCCRACCRCCLQELTPHQPPLPSLPSARALPELVLL